MSGWGKEGKVIGFHELVWYCWGFFCNSLNFEATTVRLSSFVLVSLCWSQHKKKKYATFCATLRGSNSGARIETKGKNLETVSQHKCHSAFGWCCSSSSDRQIHSLPPASYTFFKRPAETIKTLGKPPGGAVRLVQTNQTCCLASPPCGYLQHIGLFLFVCFFLFFPNTG